MTRCRRPAALLIAFLLALPMLAWGQSPTPPADVVPGTDQILAPVRARFAPDRRLAVFNVTVEKAASGVVLKGEVEQTEAAEAAAAAVSAAGLGPVTNALTVLPDPALGGRRFGIVRVSVANVRGRPAHSAEMVTQTVMGRGVRLLRQQSGWYHVHTEPDGYLGWIEELQLEVVDQMRRDVWQSGARAIVTAPFTTVRERPEAEAEPVTDAVAGSLLRTGARDGAYTLVMLPDGRSGFAASLHIAEYAAWQTSRQATGDAIERTARLFMGVPYLWGGTSSKGLDCSGYTKTVFLLNGVELLRDADQQAGQGTAVAIDDRLTQTRKGDLLFFGTAAAADRPERITHVAIYLGAGEFLHASGMVRRNSLFSESPIYSESLRARLLRIRRLLP